MEEQKVILLDLLIVGVSLLEEGNMFMIDLRDAINVIKVNRDYGINRQLKIGVVQENIPCLATLEKDTVVLFRSTNCGLTVEVPMTRQQIARQKENGSLITTLRTVVGVPEKFVSEVLFE